MSRSLSTPDEADVSRPTPVLRRLGRAVAVLALTGTATVLPAGAAQAWPNDSHVSLFGIVTCPYLTAPPYMGGPTGLSVRTDSGERHAVSSWRWSFANKANYSDLTFSAIPAGGVDATATWSCSFLGSTSTYSRRLTISRPWIATTVRQDFG